MFRGMIFEGLEKREMIAPVDENDMLSVGFLKMTSWDERWQMPCVPTQVDTLRQLRGKTCA